MKRSASLFALSLLIVSSAPACLGIMPMGNNPNWSYIDALDLYNEKQRVKENFCKILSENREFENLDTTSLYLIAEGLENLLSKIDLFYKGKVREMPVDDQILLKFVESGDPKALLFLLKQSQEKLNTQSKESVASSSEQAPQ